MEPREQDFETIYREIMEMARRQFSPPSLEQSGSNSGYLDWWEYSPHRTVTTAGSGSVVSPYLTP